MIQAKFKIGSRVPIYCHGSQKHLIATITKIEIDKVYGYLYTLSSENHNWIVIESDLQKKIVWTS